MNYTEKGSKLYLFSIVLVAVIGGLLFWLRYSSHIRCR